MKPLALQPKTNQLITSLLLLYCLEVVLYQALCKDDQWNASLQVLGWNKPVQSLWNMFLSSSTDWSHLKTLYLLLIWYYQVFRWSLLFFCFCKHQELKLLLGLNICRGCPQFKISCLNFLCSFSRLRFALQLKGPHWLYLSGLSSGQMMKLKLR